MVGTASEDASQGATSPAPLTRQGRLARALILAAVWVIWVPSATLYLALSGVAGGIGAWRWAAVAFIPLIVPTWLLCRRMRRRRWVMATGVGLAGLLVWGVPAQATPSFARVTAFADEWGAPPGGEFLGDAWEGNAWCFSDGCPTVVRYYAVTDAALTKQSVEARLKREGWSAAGTAQGTAYCKGDYRVAIWALHSGQLPIAEAGVRQPPPGREVVDLRIGANCV